MSGLKKRFKEFQRTGSRQFIHDSLFSARLLPLNLFKLVVIFLVHSKTMSRAACREWL